MSPPLPSLSKQKPMKPSFDELPEKKTGDEGTPSIITVDPDRRARSVRQQAKKGQRRIIFCTIILLLIVAAAAAVTFTCVKFLHKHRSSWKVPSSAGLTTDVTVDDDKKLIHTQHKQENAEHVVVMAILHEYSRHLIAYRDVSNSTCYIDRLDETFEVGYQRWESYETEGRKPKALKVISPQPIEVEVLQHIGDIHIYGHCVSGNSYWVMEIEETEVTTEMRVVYA
jgi:hypothetical protein